MKVAKKMEYKKKMYIYTHVHVQLLANSNTTIWAYMSTHTLLHTVKGKCCGLMKVPADEHLPSVQDPNNICFPSTPLPPAAMLHSTYSLGLLACKLSFWTNLYKDAFSLGPLRSQMNKLHSGSQKDKRTSQSNKAATAF